ncbi:hypothetical protein SUGI_0445300 [Cryptomeria japonica]|nr:hypothetical protein SUGI_0445300 [Cryptomeria japonica]
MPPYTASAGKYHRPQASGKPLHGVLTAYISSKSSNRLKKVHTGSSPLPDSIRRQLHRQLPTGARYIPCFDYRYTTSTSNIQYY